MAIDTGTIQEGMRRRMTTEQPIYKDRIIQDPDILAGKPVIKGTRISVEIVLGHLAHNPDLNELFAAYPHLTVADVQACLAYAQAAVGARRKRSRRSVGRRGAALPV